VKLRAVGHQVYVSLYAGIPYLKAEPCDEEQLRVFNEAVLSFVNAGGADALVDSGVGFWTEHRMLWGERQWFRVTTTSKDKSLSQVLDLYIMRQTILLSLTTHKSFASELENPSVLTLTASRINQTAWPEAVVPHREADEDRGESVVELFQPLPTRFARSTGSASRLDRIYTSLPAWCIPCLVGKAQTTEDPAALLRRQISDHSR
jgi:hypothetical protein